MLRYLISTLITNKKVVMSDGCSNACKFSPMDSIRIVGAMAFGINQLILIPREIFRVMDSVVVRYVDPCSSDLLVVMTETPPNWQFTAGNLRWCPL